MTTTTPILKIDEIDYQNVLLGKTGKATKLVYNSTNTKSNLKLFTPKMQIMFVKNVEKEWLNYNEYSIECFLTDEEQIKKFKVFDSELEKKIKEENKQVYGDLTYFPILKPNENYPMLIKLILSRDQYGNFETVVFDKDKNKILLTEENIEEHLKRGVVFKGVIECTKLWCFNGKYGTIWKVSQLKLSEMPQQKVKDTDITHDTNGDNVYTQCMIE